jgi:hypothetical protein
MKTPKGCEWRTIIGRPVLIRTRDGVICGGNVPREWQGKRLQDRPWENKAQWILKREKERSVHQFIEKAKDEFFYGKKRFKPIVIAESIDGRIKLYIEFYKSTPVITVQEKQANGFFAEKRDHPYHNTRPTNEVKKLLTELGY